MYGFFFQSKKGHSWGISERVDKTSKLTSNNGWPKQMFCFNSIKTVKYGTF